MSNSFNISDAPDIAANLVQILSNASALATIQTTDLPGIVDEINLNQVFIEAIIDSQLPDILTAVGNNATAIGVIDGIVDAIKLKTDATPQNVRGTFTRAYLSTTSATPVPVVDITGHGKLHMVSFKCDDVSDTIRIYLNIDGVASSIDYTGDADPHLVIPHLLCATLINFQPISETDVRNKLFNLEFSTSLLINISRHAGTADNVRGEVYYSLDPF
ncbi:hypothetical protein ES705_17509 [subsurface metagenome]